jgi:hypothetical protein
MNKYLCRYAYSSHETEGHLRTEPEQRIIANSKGEALYKYICLIEYRQSRKITVGFNLSDYLSQDYAEGGWGYSAIQLHDSEELYLLKDFENAYKEFINSQ